MGVFSGWYSGKKHLPHTLNKDHVTLEVAKCIKITRLCSERYDQAIGRFPTGARAIRMGRALLGPFLQIAKRPIVNLINVPSMLT